MLRKDLNQILKSGEGRTSIEEIEMIMHGFPVAERSSQLSKTLAMPHSD
jgi:hypothetical protein